MSDHTPIDAFRDTDVAVVGLSGRFPKAPDPDSLWRRLSEGEECITFFTEEEMLAAGTPPARLADPRFVRAAGVLTDIDRFDAGYFGFSPREAEVTDPQQRIFLECAHEALENAGYDPERYAGKIGIYAGTKQSTYLLHVYSHSDLVATVGDSRILLGNEKDHLSTWVAYKLDLKGPSMTVQTACSTSLVAVHLAVQSLIDGDCDMALAGGVAVVAKQTSGYLYRPDDILSPDGHCRAFDARAEGTVAGNGAGVVVLKRLVDAVEDGDSVRAVIRGSAINNDGSLKVGYTAPSVEGQARVISEALAVAEVEPETIDYVEAHGTGTALGDPIEVEALHQAFAGREGRCALGTIKSNLGHLDHAAGVAGMIKTVLSLEKGAIPPSLHYESPNPKIDFDAGPFFVNTELRPWSSNGRLRRAGVSSFGIGGTNAHVVLEEAPAPEPTGPSRPWHLLPISARTPEALEAVAARLADRLESAGDGLDLEDAAYTLQIGRRRLPWRRAVVARDAGTAATALRTPDPARTDRVTDAAGVRPLVFLFPGQGAQHPGMAAGLYRTEEVFRDEVDRCAELLRPELGVDLRELLFPEPGSGAEDAAAARLRETAITQPALFVVELALARLWSSWGIEPDAMIGHSLGELTAACLAEVFTTEEALRLVALRGRLMQEQPAGAMLSVPLGAGEVEELLGPGLSLAAVNAPSLCTVAGPEEAVSALAEELAGRGVEARRLETSHAFHSAMMEPAVERFVAAVREAGPRAPQRPFVSGVTGTWVRPEEATDPEHWGRQIRRTVRFGPGIEEVLALGDPILLEVGPGRTLGTLVRRREADAVVVPSLPHPRDPAPDPRTVLDALGRLWSAGVEPDWEAFHDGERRRRVPLPTYPFERQRYWIDPRRLPGAAGDASVRRPDPADWLYAPTWKRTGAVASTAAPPPAGRWLLFDDGGAVASRLADRLREGGGEVWTVRPGSPFTRHDDSSYEIDPAAEEDYRRLVAEIVGDAGTEGSDRPFPGVVHLWSAAPADRALPADLGYYSLLRLARAVDGQRPGEPWNVLAVTSHLQQVTGEESLRPERALLVGCARVLPQEIPGLRMGTVDLPASEGADAERLAAGLLAELHTPPAGETVAFRGAFRWVQGFEPWAPPARAASAASGDGLRRRGLYLVTGGLGGVGLVHARHLAERAEARLVLTGRSALPEEAEWDAWLADHPEGDPVRVKIEAIRELRALGAEVMPVVADVADEEAMARVLREAEERFGELAGVIHAAGVVGPRALRSAIETDAAQSDEQFRAKVEGTRVLDRLLADRNPDFCLLVSSLASILGGLGFTAYAAANAHLDAFAARASRRGGPPWLSVSWDGWRFGAAAAEGAPEIVPSEGRRVLDLVLGGGLPEGVVPTHLAVSTTDLEARRARWVERPAESRDDEAAPEADAGSHLHPRPALSTEFVAPSGEIEELLAETWQQLLGIEGIGADDDFFELGGDSLLATQLFGRLRQKLEADLPLRAIFEAPTVSRLAAVIGARSEAPAAGAPGDGAAVGPPIVPVPRDGDLPLSFAQQRLWFLHQMEPESTAYNIYSALRLPGRFVHPTFEAALSELRRRHEVLRTTFRSEGARPVQVVARARFERLPLVDLSGLHEEDRESELRRLALAEARRPFDLEEGPLLRARAVRAAPEDHSLLATMHHSVTDLWSRQIFVREVAALYGAFGDGEPSPLAELPVQYADFAHWQRHHLVGETLDSEIDFWRRRLDGAPPLLELPIDRPRPSVQTYRGGGVGFRLDAGLAGGLAELGRRRGATLFMTLLAGFFAVLHRTTGQRDLVVGTPVAGRDRPEVEGLIGCFINTLALRADTAGGPGFLDLLERVRDAALDAYAHQDLPFEKLVEHVDLERSVAYSPIFQVMFGLYNLPRTPEAAPSARHPLRFVPLGVDSPVAKFDLEIQMAEAAQGLTGSVTFNRDLFDPTTVRRLVDRFEALLAASVAAPERSVDELPLLAPAERHQIAHEWNDTVAALPADRPLHRWIEEQAERTPDAVAVVFEAASLSYAELVRRSATLARRLGELGVGPDSVVGICVDRSLDLLVGLLGILEAGGAYLPLDAALPPERLRLMAEDAGVEVVLADPAIRAALEQGDGAPRVRIVPVSDGDSPAAPAPARPAVSGHGLAYVIYTSGSTGRPKGVMSSHRGIVNRLLWMQRAFGLGPADGVLQKTVFTFDVSVWELFWPLMVGARLVVARPGAHWDSSYLAEVVRRERITTLHFVPSMLDLFLEEPEAGGCASLSRVVCSGEALPRDVVERFHRRLGAGLYNLYGPTEAAVDVTWWACRRGPEGASVPIGRPVANTAIHLVDRRFRPVPPGVAGELLIGGVQLARGYLGRPALTAERFVPDPFGGEPGARVYRTGDLARHAQGGEVEFLGRFDHQVKVRGLRIELGEIEAALAEHPAVRQAVVTVRDGGAGGRLGRRRLVAYTVPSEGASAETGDLQSHLRRRLPDYMVPAVFVELPELPTTSSGKVDRKALPAPDRSRPEGAEELAPPRTGIERTIAAIWQDVLGLDRVGLHDNFFDLGGHSLLVLEAHHRLAAELDRRIPLTTYFQYPTLASLAEFLSRGEDTRFLEERQERAAGRKDAMAQRRAERLSRRPAREAVMAEKDTAR